MDNPNQPTVPTPGASQRKFPFALVGIAGLLATAVVLAIYFAPHFFIEEKAPPKEYPRLQIGGTSTIAVIVENRWKGKIREDKGVELAYESTGTTKGVSHLIDGTFTIAFTHGPLSAEQRSQAAEKGEVVHVPVLLIGVTPVYNLKALKGKPALKLNGQVLADIFLGKITTWNDPALRALNPGVELPPTKITVVHREESSGTTQIFTEYLDAVSAGAWRAKAGPPRSEANWPTGVAAPRNLGVATLVAKTEGAIGYIDRLFATYQELALDYPAIENNVKEFIKAEPKNMTAAAAAVLAQIPDDLNFDLTNKSGPDACPISGLIYAVCYRNQPEARRQQVIDFLHWVTHEGQPDPTKMPYAPLPPELVKRIEKKLETIK
jgi:phosphate transport system substrate-binding protein